MPPQNASIGRNLLLCFDGTSNQFGPENTSIVRLVQSVDRDPARQRVYYDPGIGTLPEPGLWTSFGKKISEIVGLAFGVGLTRKVQQGYAYLMETWQPGDRVFLFGFSRGAYTARVLAGLLHVLGLLPRGNDNLIPYLLRLYKAVGDKPESEDSPKWNYWRLCNAFRSTFAREITPGDQDRRFLVHFLGVWDTVSSVGWVWDPPSFTYTARNPSVRIVRHAVAIDERRWFFRQNLFTPADGQDLLEVWFAGVHADVGGGYPEEEGGLWRAPFLWMIDAAKDAGVLIDDNRLQKVLRRTRQPERPWSEPKHESLTPAWWLAEFFPKWQWQRSSGRALRVGLGRRRTIPRNALLHQSAVLRIQEGDYRPSNLPDDFVHRVQSVHDVAEIVRLD
jgi:uncharacterized protein (DUF2235 family)